MTAPAVLDHAPSPPLVLDRAALRRARADAGLSLRQVGAVIGRHWSTVGQYEDDVDVPASMLGALAGLYRVDVGTFFTTQ
jgi:hypothetical protein